ncbi:FitA-like ribbon-helix-helix domain-containing protein [Microbacterium sp. JB110]|uniref:FitA-like ribbon-helix-helix domain-containing protein n=1 Tax=Microbacterium sp. JB110 TaxID=2024477 RepID=UPI00097F15F2|nr:hypothetical protein [Microbacterium sp. JB110]RCS58863.1 hypothetical protein CIK77_14250 [Microbacterium sp. JB110]SJM55186.1 hypothetical protein CZ774_07165 [Frigoribacterium sp. JB110]
MSVNITIRAVPDDVRDVLAARAADAGKSLQEFLSAELAQIAARPSPLEAIARARAHAAALPQVDGGDLRGDLAADKR